MLKHGPKFHEPPPPAAEAQPARLSDPPAIGATVGQTRMYIQRETLDRFASMLASVLDRPVVDKTGLKGRYSFMLAFVRPVSLIVEGGPNVEAMPDIGLPDVFRAVQSQLGLKLEAVKGPAEVLVIDRLEKMPTEN